MCLLDEKLDRQENEKIGRLEENKGNNEYINNKGSTDVVNVNHE